MQVHIEVPDWSQLTELFGSLNANVQDIEKNLNVAIESDAQGVVISGEANGAVKKAEALIRRMLGLQNSGHALTPQLSQYLAHEMNEGNEAVLNFEPGMVCLNAKGQAVRTKTHGQTNYVETIRKHDVTFGIGPAGTGKTYLAVALAVNAFRAHEVDRIILTRPAVEAGEKLGFLPGDLQTKVDPYMRPLYDALQEMLGAEQYLKNMERGLIEVSPLAYMRGRTLDNSFIILDEAQNTTPEQMKMFLTRIGFHSKVVVTGDLTQMDLGPEKRSGLREVQRILKGVEGLAFVELTASDVVRNPMVQRIIEAYDKFDAKLKNKAAR